MATRKGWGGEQPDKQSIAIDPRMGCVAARGAGFLQYATGRSEMARSTMQIDLRKWTTQSCAMTQTQTDLGAVRLGGLSGGQVAPAKRKRTTPAVRAGQINPESVRPARKRPTQRRTSNHVGCNVSNGVLYRCRFFFFGSQSSHRANQVNGKCNDTQV